MTTHKPKPPEGVALVVMDSLPPTLDIPPMQPTGFRIQHGISDITAQAPRDDSITPAVVWDKPCGIGDVLASADAHLTPAVLKATLFSEALCRLEQMKGERDALDRNIIAQQDRVQECHHASVEAERAEIRRVFGDPIMHMTVEEWEKLTPEEKSKFINARPVSKE